MFENDWEEDGECWAFVFETADAAEAARNLYLHRFSQTGDSVEQIREDFELNGYSFGLKDIDDVSLSEIVEEHIREGTGGYNEYQVNHCIIEVVELQRLEKTMIRGRGGAFKAKALEVFEETFEEIERTFGCFRELGLTPRDVRLFLDVSDGNEVGAEGRGRLG